MLPNDELIRATSERLYNADFLKRQYLATYVAEVQVLLNERDELRAENERLRATVAEWIGYRLLAVDAW